MWGDWKEPESRSPIIITVSVGNEDWVYIQQQDKEL